MKTFSEKANLDTESVRLTKLPEKNLLKVQNLLCSNSQIFCRNVLKKNYLRFKVPSGQLKCSFENPAAKFSPGVSKSLPQSRLENFKKLFFKKFFLGNVFWTPWPQFWRPHWKKKLSKVQSSLRQIPENVSSRNFLKANLVCKAKFVWTKGTFDKPDEKSWWNILNFVIKCWKWSKKQWIFSTKRIF